ncbi:uncharacterized protein K460DRAFT_289584, partial [Cucurbitaria berberidis CBS 394.84]
KKLQTKRRLIEGDCSVCREGLELGVKELTFCSMTCGNNFHHDCIERWKEQPPDREALRCPVCREKWESERTTISVHRFKDFNSVAFEIYVEWLYHGQICVEPSQSGKPKFHHLVEAYLLGVQIQDNHFCKAVLHGSIEIFRDHHCIPCPQTIAYAYEKTCDQSPLRKLLVRIYVIAARQQWFHGKEYLAVFMHDLALALLKESPRKKEWDAELVKREFCADEGYDKDMVARDSNEQRESAVVATQAED